MRKKSGAVRYSAKQIKTKIARGEDRTNWAKVKVTTGAELEASIRADVDDVHSEPDWTLSVMGVPAPNDHINIRIDHDVLEWFKKNGRGYQTLMNNVLRALSRRGGRVRADQNRNRHGNKRCDPDRRLRIKIPRYII
jgi:uncharacterized protein (DUF4415 family)